jgi:dTDP-4-dehydrorhamnose 3,5-epimerase
MTTEQTFIDDGYHNLSFQDERGYFFEGYNQAKFYENGISMNLFKTISLSLKVIRGLHFRLILMHKPSWFVLKERF